jgi:hypothetical protein
MDDTKEIELLYSSEKPDVALLKKAYDDTVTGLAVYQRAAKTSFDTRHNIWAGKSEDLRKKGADAFPWTDASDTEVFLSDNAVNTYIALFMNALQRANIRANPVGFDDIERSATVSAFLRWMVASYIPDFRRQMELGANDLLTKGVMITHVGWLQEKRTFLQDITLEQMAAVSPDLVRAIMEKTKEEEIIALFGQFFGKVDDKKFAKRMKEALKDLRKTGKARIPVSRNSVDCPCVESMSPDQDLIFPNYTRDYQSAPHCFRLRKMTPQAIENAVATLGWDEEWAEAVLKVALGKDYRTGDAINNRVLIREGGLTNKLVDVVYAYQRLIDEDGAEGIYETIFCPLSVEYEGREVYAKHSLMNGFDDYPVVVTKLGEESQRLYEGASVPERLRGLQMTVKAERDSRIDRNSLSTVPPLLCPVGSEPKEWGPKSIIPYRRQNEISFAPTPQFNPGSIEIENTMLMEANKVMGLDHENPLAPQRQQFFINKFLEHVRDVIKLAFKCYQRFGPESVFFRVTGKGEGQTMSKGSADENYDITIEFDVMLNDPENMEKILQQFVSLRQLDANGRIDMDLLLGSIASMISPTVADAILRPAQTATQEVTRDVMDDLSKIYAGMEMGARPNGAQIAMQVIQQYVQQPDVSQRLSADEAFYKRLVKYQEQYQFQIQQAQNAQIGKLGTAPAQVGGMQTQGIQQ